MISLCFYRPSLKLKQVCGRPDISRSSSSTSSFSSAAGDPETLEEKEPVRKNVFTFINVAIRSVHVKMFSHVFRAASRFLPVSRPSLALRGAQKNRRAQERQWLCAAVRQVFEMFPSHLIFELKMYSLISHTLLHISLLKDFRNKASPRSNLKFRFDRLSQSAAVRLCPFMTCSFILCSVSLVV